MSYHGPAEKRNKRVANGKKYWMCDLDRSFYYLLAVISSHYFTNSKDLFLKYIDF
jgi:hypothetical protein